MIGLALRAAGLCCIYLLVLTSVAPGDVLVGGILGLAVAAALRRRAPRHSGTPRLVRAGAFAGMLAATAREMVIGSWRVVRYCLGGRASPGFVEIPRGDRSRRAVALWGVLTGEAPDEIPVDVDEARDVLIVHVLHADDPDGVRERHRRTRERWHRHVAP